MIQPADDLAVLVVDKNSGFLAQCRSRLAGSLNMISPSPKFRSHQPPMTEPASLPAPITEPLPRAVESYIHGWVDINRWSALV